MGEGTVCQIQHKVFPILDNVSYLLDEGITKICKEFNSAISRYKIRTNFAMCNAA